MNFTTLRFASPGMPSTTKGGTIEGVAENARIGLHAMELEFVHSVNISKDKTVLVKEAMTKHDVTLTCHAPYYINLNAIEKKKLEASKQRLLNAALVADACGAWSITFHPAYYLGMPPDTVHSNTRKALAEIQEELKQNGETIRLSPETTGKPSQYGDINELLTLSHELGIAPCIDFSHLHARSNGKWNTTEEFKTILTTVEEKLGKNALKQLHCHISGIAYSAKGEQHHLNLEESDMKYEELLNVCKDFKVAGTIVSESPNREEDAFLLKRLWEKR